MSKKTLLWFTNNLRIADNPALLSACNSDKLLCVFVVEPSWFRANRYSLLSMGQHRRAFLYQALDDLSAQLEELGQRLHLVYDTPLNALTDLIVEQGFDRIITSEHPGWYETYCWQQLGSRFPELARERVACHTLWSENQLGFSLDELPETFSRFRRRVEKNPVNAPIATPDALPKPIDVKQKVHPLPSGQTSSQNLFTGGERAAIKHLEGYFETDSPSTYKETRNALDGFDQSTKFSPWLALGNISPRQINSRLRRYEQEVVENESTYWIYFELLWREYFQWYAKAYGRGLYAYRGPFKRSPLTSFYPQQFKSWCTGSTPFPIVNACMNQLNETGYMSNRGRQLVASCLIHELQIDWRYGAAYFEQQLLDFDVASNWGNWQYLGGVGADPRGSRRFNLQKQTDTYDPNGEFVAAWRGVEQARAPITLGYYDG